MRKVTKVSLISLREATLITYLALSLGLCYMLAETISIFIQYFFYTDVVLTYDVYRYAFIYPNVILLTFLFIWIHLKPTIKVKYLIFIPPAFYAVQYLLVLLFAGVKKTIGWHLFGFVSDGRSYQHGFRYSYSSLNNRFYERINLWDAKEVWIWLLAILILYIGTLFIYRFLRKYVAIKTQPLQFAEAVHVSELNNFKHHEEPKISKYLIGFREFSLIGYLFFSLALCYMIAEGITPFIQYFWWTDYTLTQYDYEVFYIVPNIVLLIVMFFWLHKNDKIKIPILMLLQIIFYIVHHLTILLLLKRDSGLYWLSDRYSRFYPVDYYHLGLRNFYMNDLFDKQILADAYQVWLRLGFALVMFIGFGILFSYSENTSTCRKPFYIRKN